MPMIDSRRRPMGRRRCNTAPTSNSLCRYASTMGSTCHVTGKCQIHTIRPRASRSAPDRRGTPRQQPWGGVPPGGSMGVGALTRRSVLALPPLWSSRSGPYSGQRVPWVGVRLARRRSAPLGPASGAVGRPSRRR